MPFIPIGKGDIEQPLIEDGTYPARIDKVKVRKSQAGNEVIMVSWTIQMTDPPGGQRVLDNITLIPEAFWRLDQLAKATGFTFGDEGFQTEDLMGRECQIVITKEEYPEGSENFRNRVSGYVPL